MRIRCSIIDDDRVFTRILEHYIKNVDFLEHVSTYNDSSVAFTQIEKDTPNVIFVDMEMPKLSGVEFIESISMDNINWVFISKSNAYGSQAFQYSAIDYLNKPFSFKRFLTSANKIKDKYRASTSILNNVTKDYFFIKQDGLWLKIIVDTVRIVKADNNHVIIRTTVGDYRTNLKMKEIIEKLPSDSFMQVHRSYIVNINAISVIDGEVIEVNNKTVPVSKSYITQLYKKLNIG